MRELLTQEEIDALLANVEPGRPPTATAAASAARPFELASRQRIRKQSMPGLERLNQRFSEHFRASLSRLLGRDIEISAQPAQHVSFGEYRHGLYIPSSLTLLRIAPLTGMGMVVADARLVSRMVDILFGGSGQIAPVQGREFSVSENRLIHRFIDILIADLQNAWSPLRTMNCEVIGQEVNPVMASIAGSAEPVIVSRFLVDSDQGGGEFHLVVPLTSLEPLRESLSRPDVLSRSHADPRWQRALQAAVLDTRVATHCTLAEKKINLRELATLQVGDVIGLGGEQSVYKAAGMPVCRANVGLVNGRLALKITETL